MKQIEKMFLSKKENKYFAIAKKKLLLQSEVFAQARQEELKNGPACRME